MSFFLNHKNLAAMMSLLVITACSRQSESSSTTTAPTEVKGEPIRKLAETAPPPDDEFGLPIADPAEAPGEAAEVSAEQPLQEEEIEVMAEVETPDTPETIRSGDRDYLSVGFDRLASYEFEVTDDLLEAKGDLKTLAEKSNNMIPETVRKLNESSVALKGYMLPLKVEQGQVTEFLLMRDQSMCCFGTVPKINEWVSVKTIGAGVKPIMDQPVTIFGTLHVGEIRENGYLVGIYRMDGETLAGPLDL
jgi:hypothetical protein